MILDREITIYSNVRDRSGHDATFGEFLRACQEHKQVIEQMRMLPKEQASAIKLNLPCATISGRFAPTRSASNLQKHSGLLCLDFDNITDIPRLMQLLESMDIVCYCSRSVSGKGVFAVVLLAYPDKHKQQFESLRRYFANRGYEIDKACKDIPRLRVISYDPDARIRLDAVPYEGVWVEPRQEYTPTFRNSNFSDTEARVKTLCEKIISWRCDITNGYQDWLNIGFALADLGEAGREYFHAVSSVCSKYKRDDCDKKFTECLKSRKTISIDYFFKICKGEGITYK